jgi:hypothetical protein
LADIGGIRFWRIDPRADYGDLNHIARRQINLRLIGNPVTGRCEAETR